MSCPDRQESLQEYLAGELGSDEARALEAHLRECPACARDLETYRAIFAALPQVPDPAVPPCLHREIMTTVRARRPAWKQRETPAQTLARRAVAIVMAAAFGVSLSVALWGWMGRIITVAGHRFSVDLLDFWGAARELWQIVRLLIDVMNILQPAMVGLGETLRRSAQSLAPWGPLLLTAYAGAALLGGWLCWRAFRQGNERGFGHAA